MIIKSLKIIPGAIFILLLLSLPLAANAFQTDYIIYLPLIQKQSFSWVNTQNRDESLTFYQENYILSGLPAINWSGSHESCDPGTTNPDFQGAVLRRINYFRGMAGVPDGIVFSEESNLKAQAAALLMSVNEALDHDPPETWTCYSALADEGAGSSNLYLGINGWEAITGYMQDAGTFNDAVGHRRWILYPQTQVMGSGDIPATDDYFASNALVVFDEYLSAPRPDTRDSFVAWPPPGYIPYPVVFTRWSFSYPDADFSQASVSMYREDHSLAIIQAMPVYDYGENTIVWQIVGMNTGVDWPRPDEDTSYTIDITDVLLEGQPHDFSYQVILFDPDS